MSDEPEPERVTRGCVNCRGENSMWLLCDPRLDLEWFHCSLCGHVESIEAR